jgi:phosphatidylglycerophosphate synthase
MTSDPDRRPLASRGAGWAKALARRLSDSDITPNQISQAGIGAAALAGGLLWLSFGTEGTLRAVLLIAAAVFIQIRLLCNLLDGMVAVEGGKGTADGAFWNEVPDRIEDTLILVGAGLATGWAALGWAAAAMAILTAYVRALGGQLDAPTGFIGPMAKPHRMALMTGALVLACFEGMIGWGTFTIEAALWIVIIGGAITAGRRAYRIITALNSWT